MRRRRRSENTRPLNVVLTGGLVVGILMLVLVVVVRTPTRGLPGIKYRTVYASVDDPGNLQPLNDVRLGGIRVGQAVTIGARAQRANLKLRLDPGTEPLPSDTRVVVRGAGLLGQRYVQLVPGHSRRPLRDGATVRGGPDSLTNGVPDALNTFDPATRKALGSSIDQLSAGLLGRGRQLNDALPKAPPDGVAFKALIDAALARPGAVRRLVPALESTSAPLNAAKEDFTKGFGPAADALQPFVDRRGAVEATLDEAPGTLRAARTGLTGGRRLLAAVRTLSVAATGTLPSAPAGLRAATALLRDSHQPLAKADKLLVAAEPAVPATIGIVRDLDPLLDPLRRALDDLDPIVGTLGAHGCDIDNFGEDWRSLFRDNLNGKGQSAPLPDGYIGPLGGLRITAIADPTALQGLSKPSAAPGNVSEPYSPPCRYSPGPRYAATGGGG